MNGKRRALEGRALLAIAIGAVWIFHGCYSKLAGGIPRHRLFVARILGDDIAEPATLAIGVMEVLLGIWVFTNPSRKSCVTVQTLALVSMNTLEILLAPDLLISAPGMVALNPGFISVIPPTFDVLCSARRPSFTSTCATTSSMSRSL